MGCMKGSMSKGNIYSYKARLINNRNSSEFMCDRRHSREWFVEYSCIHWAVNRCSEHAEMGWVFSVPFVEGILCMKFQSLLKTEIKVEKPLVHWLWNLIKHSIAGKEHKGMPHTCFLAFYSSQILYKDIIFKLIWFIWNINHRLYNYGYKFCLVFQLYCNAK